MIDKLLQIKRINKKHPPGFEDGVTGLQVSWLIEEVERITKETQALRSELEKERNNNYRLRYILDEIKKTIQNG